MQTLHIAIATGTRADWGLLSRLARALDSRPDCRVTVLATNMHLSPLYGNTIDEIRRDGFEPVAVPASGEDGGDGSSPLGMALATAGTTAAMARELERLRPDKIVVLGDRFEMLATATAALMLGIPIVHIAGGETSEGAIDDAMRHAITQMAQLHLVAAEPYRRRVIAMGADPARVVNTGAIGVDDMASVKPMGRAELEASLGFAVPPETLLVTFHPATRDAVSPASRCGQLLEALDRFPDRPVIVTYPNNDARGAEIIETINRWRPAGAPGRVRVVPSLGHRRYLSALRLVAAVVGNSSSGIVEAPSAGVPTVDIGIRQKGRIAAASVTHCGDTADEIEAAIRAALARGRRNTPNPYHRPGTLQAMVHAITGDTAESAAHSRQGAARPLYIIPARGGSKGIPRKNIKPLAGKPLIHYSIDTAMELTGDPRRIVVSTDDAEIAEVARRRAPVSVRRRPARLATDTAGSREVMLDAMDWADAQGIGYDCVVLLQPTSPLRQPGDVRRCLERYAADPEADMVTTVGPAPCNPYYDCFEADSDGALRIAKGDGLYTRRQDAPPAWQLNGAVYVINPASLRAAPMGSFARRVACEMPAARSLDLDTLADWQAAEAMLNS